MILSEWAFTSGHCSSITLKQTLRAFLRARIALSVRIISTASGSERGPIKSRRSLSLAALI